MMPTSMSRRRAAPPTKEGQLVQRDVGTGARMMYWVGLIATRTTKLVLSGMSENSSMFRQLVLFVGWG